MDRNVNVAQEVLREGNYETSGVFATYMVSDFEMEPFP